MSQQQSVSAPVNSLNVNKLGVFLDGWSDIVEGMGDKANQVRQNILSLLQGREMPDIALDNKVGYVSLISKDRRDYIVSETFPGARTTIYIAQHGNDLYASWRTWIEPKINWNLWKWILIGAAVLGFLTGGIQQSNSFYGPSQTNFSLIGWIGAMIGYLVLTAIVLAVVGRVIKGNFLAYFFIEPNVFDAEDITAMSLSVHKSVLRALDSAGIDSSKLRLKQDFKGGRRDQVV
jgi:hypothetical protein